MPVCRNGRRGRLKICCQQWRVGSSPTTGTKIDRTGQKSCRFFYFKKVLLLFRQYNQGTILLIAENLSDYIVSSFEIRQYSCIPRLHNQKNFLAMSRRYVKKTALFSGAAPDRKVLSYCKRRATKSKLKPFLQKSIVPCL